MKTEDELSWSEKHIITRIPAYKKFIKEFESNREDYLNKGLTKTQERFLDIYNRLNYEKAKEGYTFKIAVLSENRLQYSLYISSLKAVVSQMELLEFSNKHTYIYKDIPNQYEIPIKNELEKEKFLSDLWAKELEKKTDLSLGLTLTQIDERQAYHFRNYEIEVDKLGIEINPFIGEDNENQNSAYQLDWEENNQPFDHSFSEEDFGEILSPASDLPSGWIWREYDDGSGSLNSPGGYNYYSYDLQTQEFRAPNNGNEWTGIKDFYEPPKSLGEFKIYAEKDLKEKAEKNNLSPKLSEDEKNNLLAHKSFMKEKEFILENLRISQDQREAYSAKMEFGINGEYSLTDQQLGHIPDVLDGHDLSKSDKYELAFGFLEKQLYGESYEVLENGEILKSYLGEDYLPLLRILTINDIKFNNQNPNIMETEKEFDQVQYLKDQLKYLGFGESEKLHKDLEKGIKSVKQQFEIKTSSDKALPGNQVDFILKFNKSESGGVFLNAYNAALKNEKGEEISHNFPVNRENNFTAKEAVNLLEGRAVKIEFQNPKTEQLEPAFVKFNFEEPKTEKGNYQFQNFYKNYGVDTANIVDKSNLIFDKPEYKENTIKSLEKGNVVKVKFELDDKVVEGKAVLNPQYKNLNLYDQDMSRINTNKPLEGIENENKQEKNNAKEQSLKR